MTVEKMFTATKAFINYNGKVLIIRESSDYEDGTNAGRWDVLGGRVKPGQRFDESMLREIQEETGLSAKIESPIHVDEWRPKVRGKEWQVIGIFFKCSADSNSVTLSEDHDNYQWINPQEYKNYNLIPIVSKAFEKYLKE